MGKVNREYIKENHERLFDSLDFITARPEGMDKDEYRAKRRSQDYIIKQYLKGKTTHVSKLYPAAQILKEFGLKPGATDADIMAVLEEHPAALLLLKGRTYERD